MRINILTQEIVMLIVLVGGAALAAAVHLAWSLVRLWRAVPRDNRDLVLF